MYDERPTDPARPIYPFVRENLDDAAHLKSDFRPIWKTQISKPGYAEPCLHHSHSRTEGGRHNSATKSMKRFSLALLIATEGQVDLSFSCKGTGR